MKQANSDEIKSRQWSDRERQALREAAAAQAAGSDAGLDLTEIPQLTGSSLPT